MERPSHADFGWLGMDLRTAPERLGPGVAQSILNLRPMPGGQLEARPGWRGMLTSAQGNPIYGLTAFRRSGTTRLFWSGNNSLYYADAGATSATDVTGSVTVASSTVRTARWGSYIYGVDGTNSLFRWDGTNNAAVVTNLTTPTSAPTPSAGAAGTLLTSPGTTGDWSQPYDLDTGSYYPFSDLITEPNLDSASGTSFPGGGQWNVDEGQPTINTGSSPEDGGFQFVELDGVGGGVPEYVITDAITVPTDSVSKGARVYLFEANAWGESIGATTQVLSASVRLYTDAGTTLVTSQDTTQVQYSDPLVEGASNAQVRMLFDWRGVTDDVLAAKLRIGAPNASGTAGINVNQISLTAPKMELELSASGGSLVVKQGSVQVWDGTLLTAGLRLYNDTGISGTEVWTGKTQAFFDLTVDEGVTGLSMKMLILSGTTWYTGPTLFAAAGGGYTADLTQFTTAVLGAVDGIGLEIEDDVTITGLAEGGSAHLFTLAAVTEGGNLTTGYPYSYRFSEWDGSSWVGTPGPDTYEGQDGTESSGSPVSISVTPTAGARQVSLSIPARTNAGADYILVWREGGVYDDGRFRLVGVVSSSASVQTFTDNNSDADLYEYPIYQVGRDAFPSALTCLCVHQGRLWAAKGNTIYVSWVLQQGQETGVYTTLVPDPDDPFIGEKGASFTLDTSGNADAIKALVPMGTVVIALRENSVSVVSGYDATNFAAQPYLQDSGVGSVSGTAATVFGGQLWYLSPVGVYTFNGDNAVYRSLPIETRLHSNTVDLTTAFTVSHDQRLYLCSKYLGSSVNSNVWVYDSRTEGWFRYGCPSTIGFTSGCSLSSAADSGVLYMGGSDGQVYAHTTGTIGDKLTPAASNTAFTAQVITRLYGQDANLGVSRLGEGRVVSVDFDVYTAASATLTLRVDNESGVYESNTWALGTGRTAAQRRGWLGIKGVGHSVDLGASVSDVFQVNGVRVVFGENAVRRV